MAGQRQPAAGTVEVRESHRFDVAALEVYLRAHVAGFSGPLTVRQFQGGQSRGLGRGARGPGCSKRRRRSSCSARRTKLRMGKACRTSRDS